MFVNLIYLSVLIIITLIKDSISLIKETNLVSENGTFLSEESPLLLSSGTDKYFVTDKQLLKIDGTKLINQNSTNDTYQLFLRSNPKYVYVSIDTLLYYYRFNFFYPRNYEVQKIIFSPIEKQDPDMVVSIVNVPQKSQLKHYNLNDNFSLLYGQIDDINGKDGNNYTYFFGLNIDDINNSTIFKKSGLPSDLECLIKNISLFCYGFNSSHNLYFYNFSDYLYEDPSENITEDSNNVTIINDTITCPIDDYVDIVSTTNEKKTKLFLAVLGRSSVACLYLFSEPNFNYIDKASVNIPFLIHDWGFNNSKLFIIEHTGDDDIYVVFNGGNTLQFFVLNSTTGFQKISINGLDYGNSHFYFYGSHIFFEENKFIYTTTILNQYATIQYLEFDFPYCQDKTYPETNVDIAILLKDLKKSDQDLDSKTSFLYIENPNSVQETKVIKNGEFLCVQISGTETKYVNLADIYYELEFCENIIYHPTKQGSSEYSFYIFNKIQTNLYIPSKKPCKISISNKCYDTCSNCEYVGNEEHHLCTDCVEGKDFFKIERDTQVYKSGTSNQTVGDCITGERENYYIENNVYKPCYEGCLRCDNLTTKEYPICIECAERYYPRFGTEANGTAECYDALCLEDFTFDLNTKSTTTSKKNGVCKQKASGCFQSCSECQPENGDTSTLQNPYCTKCASSDFIQKYLTENKVCISMTNKYNYFYEHPNFNECYDSCLSCLTFGKIDRPNCKQCDGSDENCTYSKEALADELLFTSKRNRNDMLTNLDYNAKVYTMAGGLFQPEGSTTSVQNNVTIETGYFLECYYSDMADNYSSEYNKLNITQCENYIRSINSTVANTDFIVCKVDYKNNQQLITRQSEYSLYSDLLPPGSASNDEVNVTKLDLSLCADKGINVEIYYKYFDEQKQYKFEDGFELSTYNVTIYNYNDQFFHDQCFIITHGGHTDLSLRHRVEHFFVDIKLCEDNCRFIRLNNSTRRIECECDIKTSINMTNNDIRLSLNDNINIKSYDSLIYYFEFGYYKCLKLITMSGLFTNQAVWIYVFLIAAYLVTVSYIFLYEFIYIRSRFEGIYRALKGKNKYYTQKVKEAQKKYVVEDDVQFLNGFVFFLENKGKENEQDNEEEEEEEENHVGVVQQIIKLDPCKKKQTDEEIVENENEDLKKEEEEFDEIDLFELKNKYKLFKRDRYNNYNYYLALKEDKRKCCQMIISIFKEKDIFMRCMYRVTIMELFGYNATFIILYIAEVFYLNVLGFTPTFINNRYLGEGQSPYMDTIEKEIVIYIIIHYIVNRVNSVKRFANFYDQAVNIANNPDKFLEHSPKIMKSIKCRIFTTILIQTILILFYGFSAILFCFTFPSLKMDWIYDSLIAIAAHFVLNFISSFLIGSIRMCGIKEESYKAYNLSLYLKEYM